MPIFRIASEYASIFTDNFRIFTYSGIYVHIFSPARPADAPPIGHRRSFPLPHAKASQTAGTDQGLTPFRRNYERGFIYRLKFARWVDFMRRG